MKKREFAQALKEIRDPKTKAYRPDLIHALPNETKIRFVHHFVRGRMAVPIDFLKGILDESFNSWLHCCGYSYEYENLGYKFRGTQAHLLHFTGSARQ